MHRARGEPGDERPPPATGVDGGRPRALGDRLPRRPRHCLLVAAQTAQRQARAPSVPAQRSGELTLLSMNAYVGQADAAAVARVVREREVDVLVVVEASPAFVSRLAARRGGKGSPCSMPGSGGVPSHAPSSRGTSTRAPATRASGGCCGPWTTRGRPPAAGSCGPGRTATGTSLRRARPRADLRPGSRELRGRPGAGVGPRRDPRRPRLVAPGRDRDLRLVPPLPVGEGRLSKVCLSLCRTRCEPRRPAPRPRRPD